MAENGFFYEKPTPVSLIVPTAQAVALGNLPSKAAASATITTEAADAHARAHARVRETYERMSDRNLYQTLEEKGVAGAAGAYERGALIATAIRVHYGKPGGGTSATRKRGGPRAAVGPPNRCGL